MKKQPSQNPESRVHFGLSTESSKIPSVRINNPQGSPSNMFWFLLGLLALATVPFLVSLSILKKLDTAAKLRRQKFQLALADMFCLLFFLQLPLAIFGQSVKTPVGFLGVCILTSLLILICYTTLRTVSRAGITANKWRTLVSLIVIPSTFAGSFSIVCVLLGFVDSRWQISSQGIAILIVCCVALAVSDWITRQAIESFEQFSTTAE